MRINLLGYGHFTRGFYCINLALCDSCSSIYSGELNANPRVLKMKDYCRGNNSSIFVDSASLFPLSDATICFSK